MGIYIFIESPPPPGVALNANIKQFFKNFCRLDLVGEYSYLHLSDLGPCCSADVKFSWEEQGKTNWFAELWSPYWHLLQENLSKGKDFFPRHTWSAVHHVLLLRSIIFHKKLNLLSVVLRRWAFYLIWWHFINNSPLFYNFSVWLEDRYFKITLINILKKIEEKWRILTELEYIKGIKSIMYNWKPYLKLNHWMSLIDWIQKKVALLNSG